MKKRIALFLIVAAIAFGLYFYYQTSNKTPRDHRIILYGNVDIRDVTLGFRVSGRVEKLNYEEGDRVKKGASLARLDKVPFEQQLDLQKAQLAEVAAALENAEKVYNRKAKLVKTGATSQSDYDDALANRDQLRAQLETAKAGIALAETSLADTEILAPDGGIILTRVREPGSIVAAGAAVYTLALDNPVWIRTYIDEPHLGDIHPGQKAEVSTDSGDIYEGRIGFISPQAEFTPKTVETTQLRTDLVYRLRVIVDQPDNRLRQGMPVTVKIDR